MKKVHKFSIYPTIALLILAKATENDVFAWLLLGSGLILIVDIISEILKLRKS